MAALRSFTLTALLSLILTPGGAEKCGNNYWQCDDGACISRSWRCDGAGDCLDGSDEMDCSCPPQDFACFDGTMCVNRAAVCDGRAQCPDGSDELKCYLNAGCLSGDWTCNNKICIPQTLRCNGISDCGDGSDEEGCGTCGHLNMRCGNGTCLPLNERCDGIAQCSDRRDEPVTCGKMCRDKNGGCSHTCTDEIWGALCSCPNGMKLSASGSKCEDVDECALPYAPCGHSCINNKGSFQCKCQPGFKLLNGNVCQAQGNDTKLLTSKRGLIGLFSIKDKTFKTLLTVNRDPVALVYDILRNLVYLADRDGNIYRLDQQESRIIYSGHSGLKSLTVDWLTGQLYWSNTKLKGIYTAASDGSAVVGVMSKEINPSDLVLLPTESSMFWINKGPNEAMTLEKAGMDGSLRRSLVMVTAQMPKCLTLDVAARRLYWISEFKMSIESVKVDGTGRYSFRSFFKGKTAQNLAAFSGLFYWADDRRLWQAPQNQSGEKSLVLKSTFTLLTVYHELQQPRGRSSCRKSSCLLCLPSLASSSGFTCSCPDEKLPVSSGSCENFKLAYATSKTISTLEYTKDGAIKSVIAVSNENIQSFDVDWKRGWVIWANGTGHVKVRLPNQSQSVFVRTPTSACIVRVNPKTGNLYWVSCDGLSIGVTHILLPDQSVSQQLYQASSDIIGLFLDWQRGQFYWLEDGQIIQMKLGMLGGNAKAIYKFDHQRIGQIVFDRKSYHFFWPSLNELQVISLLKMKSYATKRWTLPNVVVAAYEPYLVTMHNDVITLWNRQNGEVVRSVAIERDVVDVVLAMNEMQQGCPSPFFLCIGSTLCIPQAQICDGKEDCPDGSDEASCKQMCAKSGDFQCKDGSKCIEGHQVCDGHIDCTDASDEVNCPVAAVTKSPVVFKCRLGFKPCKDGSECVLFSHVCDGEIDCKDGSDEEECEQQCKPDQFQCAHGKMCIAMKEVCDGTPQCQDRSDERNCLTRSKSCSHHCDNQTRCIPENFLCDGERDCADGTDEADCQRSVSSPSAHKKESFSEAVCKSPSVLCEGTSLCVSQSQLCDGQLDCPDGFDELHCLHVCSDTGHFLCKNKRKCIEQILVCDGHVDCPDGSDESRCPACPLHCDEGTVCLTKKQFCDGQTDCRDGSDEGNCYNGHNGAATSLKCRFGFKPCRDGSECVLNSHICDGERDCKDGSDEVDCEQQCKKGQFQCAHGRMCIDRTEVCDGIPQCQDRSDELNCITRSKSCSHHCDNQTRCIPENFLCDGERDCADGTDEADCQHSVSSTVMPRRKISIMPVCESPSVLCEGTTLCVLQSQLCDGVLDCPDGFDELHCLHACTDPGHFLCKNKMKCIEQILVCDGHSDCPDGSDELRCPSCPLHCDEGTVCLTQDQFCDGRTDCSDGSDEGNCYKGRAGAATSLKCRFGFKPCKDDSECVLNSHICDGERDCKDGSDEDDCEQQCKKGQFQCAHGRMCIDRTEVCDGTPQCQDRSDEINCSTLANGCSHHCDDKTRCIPENFLCDGEKDCADGTDEADCQHSVSSTVMPRRKISTTPVCESPSVLCEGTTLCVLQSQLCDGVLDCPDGFDELHCLHACTDPGHFLCKNQMKCIEQTLVCNGHADCPDGSDELRCPSCPLHCDEGIVCLTKGQFCDGRTDCIDGSDEKNCYNSNAAGASLTCRLGFKPCRDGRDCVLYSHFCDGENDCRDGSDEVDCENQCKKGQFQCTQGKLCIDEQEVCDGTPQCPDRSDELDCYMPSKTCGHRCDEKTRCLPFSLVCDGRRDCRDGSDEENCPTAKGSSVVSQTLPGSASTILSTWNSACPSPSVLCDDGTTCISQSQICDGALDCPNGSDELSCLHSCTKKGEFLCKNRRTCIESYLVCDGRSDCSDGSDEMQCSAAVKTTNTSQLTCRFGLKLCKDGSDCVQYSHLCDGETDCKDGSDEEGCDLQCSPGQFQCKLGRKCIDQKLVCDGTPQCPDNSDEASCWTPTRSCAVRCDQNNRCIPEVFICNGIRDCWDGADEIDCGNPTNSQCKSPSIPCLATAQCISLQQLCDGRKDCADGSDERPCLRRCQYQDDFLCKDRRRCIKRNLVCDGRLHCSDGSDEVNCPTVAVFTSETALKCRLGSKSCKDGSDCIPYSHVCDGEVDCRDGSDEEDCDSICKAGEFMCAHGKKCIDAKLVCDDKPHCQDRSDEMNCFTRTKSCSHSCDNKTRCIPEGFLCDGETDCVDGTDEADCGYPTQPKICESPSLLCRGGKLCISSSQVCDGKRDCPDGFDEEDCIPRCSRDDFLCKDRKKCIERPLVCDGRSDCADGSDEVNCPPVLTKPNETTPLKCRLGWWLCKDESECVLHNHVCDGEPDCKDGSDEDECQSQCTRDQFHCAHGRMCIDKKEVCDGTPQCQDRSDELNCFTQTKGCSHHCDNKTRCIPDSFLCDGEKDCTDGTDEAGCPSATAAPSENTFSPLQCKSPLVMCGSSVLCINQFQLCDGTFDCPNGFDELHCLKACTDPGQFLCKNKRQCIDRDLVCNGQSDCPDGSDELQCSCSLSCDGGMVCLTKSQFCDGRADCKDGSDERNCNKGDPTASGLSGLKCRFGFKPCRDGSECILYSHVCDGEKDCKDGSDEKDCERQCKKSQFQCAHGKMCIDKKEVCDGTPQCQDRSDELDCFKRSESCSHQCDDKSRCIPDNFICDGERDCMDGTDEIGCAKEPCSLQEFQCASGQCVSTSVLCDGHADCHDHSDERNCRKPPHCPMDQRCPNSHVCLQTAWFCDGQKDCMDGFDEQNCKQSQVQCGSFQWICASKNQCIPTSWRCDGIEDCRDHSDEERCDCSPHQFKCDTEKCLDPSLVCNGISDCVDGSDEGPGCLRDNCTNPRRPSCQHFCISTPVEVRCGCRPGFKLQADGFSCADIDECEVQPPVCSQVCINTFGSFSCHCHPGFILEPDSSSCKAPDEPILLASVQYELLLIGLRSNNLNVLLPQGKKPIFSLDYDWRRQRVYWVCLQEESIKYAIHGEKSIIKTLVKGVKSDAIAVDWLAENLYWVDGVAGQILAVRISNSVVKSQSFIVILDKGLEEPRSIVLLPQKGLMFWSEVGVEPKIKQAGMDGSDVKVVVSSDLHSPVGLAVDLNSNLIYWADEKLRSIGSATLNGENIRLLQLPETSSPFSVAVFNDVLYWSDTQRLAIHSAHKITGKNSKVVLKRPGQPYSVRVIHPLMQPKVSNPCDKLGCSHMCVLTPSSGALCRCPSGSLLAKNGFNCSLPEHSSDSFLLLLTPAKLAKIFTGHLKTDGLNQWPDHHAYSFPGISNVSGLDLVAGDMLYVTDARQASVDLIKMSDSASNSKEYALQLQGDTITSMAVDWITRNLYWSSSKKTHIFVTSAGGSYTNKVLDLGLMNASSITLHPPSGRLCFISMVQSSNEVVSQVDCAAMDGRNRMTLWKETGTPRFLSLSSQGTTLFWADIAADRICSVDVDGSTFREYKPDTGPSSIMSLTRSDNIFFWSTYYNGTSKVWYSDGIQPKMLWFEVQTNIVTMKAYSRYSLKGTNLCAENNGGCSHLCLAYPAGRTCRCTQGSIAVNDTQCILGELCPEGSQPCRDGLMCLSSLRFCDKIPDCLDGSDEDDCAAQSNGIMTRTMGGQSCRSKLCNGHGRCVMLKGKLSCECLPGYTGQFCQGGGSTLIPVMFSVLFIIGMVIVVAFVLKLRRDKAARGHSDKETLMKEMEEQETHPDNFSNELYNPEEEEVTTVS